MTRSDLAAGHPVERQTSVMEESISPHHVVRLSYDAVAEDYAAGFKDELARKPLDRALLACLAERNRGAEPGFR
jgi:hypothetical protein